MLFIRMNTLCPAVADIECTALIDMPPPHFPFHTTLSAIVLMLGPMSVGQYRPSYDKTPASADIALC